MGSMSAMTEKEAPKKVDLGDGSEVLHLPRLIPVQDSCRYFDYLNHQIPWNRPSLCFSGRSYPLPRDTCYVAGEGLTPLVYSGYTPHAHSWDEFPPLKEILDMVHKAIPGSSFNSVLLNRYNGGNDYVGWHSDNEELYGPGSQIASLSFGSERDFLLKKKKKKNPVESGERCEGEPTRNSEEQEQQHSFVLKHGSLLVMSGNTQRDWLHSVPKRDEPESTRISLTFRRVP